MLQLAMFGDEALMLVDTSVIRIKYIWFYHIFYSYLAFFYKLAFFFLKF